MTPAIGVTASLCIAFASGAAAQHIRGKVSDATAQTPVAAVKLDLARGSELIASTLSDSLGRFSLTVPRAGEYELRALRVGYATTIVPAVRILSSETLEVELALAVAAIPLDPLRIVARGRTVSRYLGEVGFYDREQRGVGSFLTRYEIERRGGTLLSDVLRNVSGVRLVRADRTGRRAEIRLRNRRCAPSVYLDGAVVRVSGPARPTDMALDDVVLSVDIDGIEVYHGPSETPAEFSRDANCGVVAIWTRRRR